MVKSSLFPYLLLALFTLIMADGLLTEVIVAGGYGVEANVFLAPMLQKTGILLAAKATGASFIVAYLVKLYGEKQKLAKFVLTTGLVLYGILFLWNFGIFVIAEIIL